MKQYKKVESHPEFPSLEREILDYWQQNKIFEKSIQKPAPHGDFVFFEGPPTANGRPGIHHVEARAFKDLFPRYKTMQGYRIQRKAGWDTHGLPVELEVEKALGFAGKSDIEKYGIAKFNQKCKASVWKYKEEWEALTRRIGFWLDLEHPYITFENEYIETLWWIIKRVWEKKLLYQGHKVVPYCPRCGTALSSHEVAQGYKKVTEESVYIKFKLKAQSEKLKAKFQNLKPGVSEPVLQKDIYFLAWTTTPWTLPGNVALALGKDIDYVLVEQESKEQKAKSKNANQKAKIRVGAHLEYFILAKRRLEILEGEYKIIQEFKGRNLAGLEYEPLYQIFDSAVECEHHPNIFRSVLADFVTTEDGTGIVHTAVMYGEDDYELGQKLDLPMVHSVDQEGKFYLRFGNLPQSIKGKFVKDAEKDIVADLKERGLLYKAEMYTHDYPFCWRCKTPLLYYAKESWFIKMSALRKQLLENNEQINWVPTYLKHGRFGKWLSEVKDWAISRERYWGTPLPVWQCQNNKSKFQSSNFKFNPMSTAQSKLGCGHTIVIGSIEELEGLGGKKVADLHRPFIDQVTFACPKCGGIMKRVEAVMDCWFDSGAMPFAQGHWPFQQSQRLKIKSKKGNIIAPPRLFPADFICEAVDQTRGWFYTLLAISTLLDYGAPYKNVISLGHVLDARGQKMSKSRGNVIDPFKALDQYSADAIRWFFYSVNKPQAAKNFDPAILKDVLSRFVLTLWNSYAFFITYASLDGFRGGQVKNVAKPENILDQWILSRLCELNKIVVQSLDSYNVFRTVKAIERFVDDLSNWYIRRSRRRFWKSEDDQDKQQGYATLYYVLERLSRMLAPLMPFLAEEIFRNLTDQASVHLAPFPAPDAKVLNIPLNQQMELVRGIVNLGLSLRAQARIKARQPLARVEVISAQSLPADPQWLKLIQEELNVKEVLFPQKDFSKSEMITADAPGLRVALATKISRALKEEGLVRDFVRAVQAVRKQAGLEVADRIALGIGRVSPPLRRALERQEAYWRQETLTHTIQTVAKLGQSAFVAKVEVAGERVTLAVKKV